MINTETTTEFINPYVTTDLSITPIPSFRDELVEEQLQLTEMSECGLAAKLGFIISQIELYTDDIDIPECLENYLSILRNQIGDAHASFVIRELAKLN